MNLESILTSQPPDQWHTHQAIIFDWYDGPREGVVCLESPDCEFYFQLLSERPTDDDLDDRLFWISELEAGTVMSLLRALRPLGEPAGAIWAPIWRFPTDQERDHAEAMVQQALAQKRDTSVVIRTPDMKRFLGCWHADRNGMPVSNWFAKLGIAS